MPTPSLLSDQYSFGLQAVFEMQKTLGKVEHAVDTLTADMREIKTKVTRFDIVLMTTGVLGAIFLGVLVWVVNVARDVGMLYVKAVVDQPKAMAPATLPPATAPPQSTQK